MEKINESLTASYFPGIKMEVNQEQTEELRPSRIFLHKISRIHRPPFEKH